MDQTGLTFQTPREVCFIINVLIQNIKLNWWSAVEFTKMNYWENRSLYRRKAFNLQRCENPWTLTYAFPHADTLCQFPHLFSHATTRFQYQNPLKHPPIQTQRPLKSWRAMATLSTLFSVLSRSWVDSPRDHECVNWRGGMTGMMLKTALNTQHSGKHKRPLKAGRAIAPFVTVCTVLLTSWVESPRTNEYVNSAGDLTYMMLKTA